MRRLAELVLPFALVPAIALGEPTVWQKTRSAQVFRESEAMAKSEKIVVDATQRQSELTPFDLKQALGVLDDAGARHSTNPLALFMVGSMLEEFREYDASEPYFRAVVAADVPGVVKAIALYDLAIIAVRRGEFRRGAAFYDDALAESPVTVPSFLIRPPRRGLLLANQAEAFMVLGDVSRAVEGYRAAIASTPPYVNAATTFFSLGVALDRSGDLDRGLDAIELAHKYDPDDKDIKGPNWAFVPAYDADWYWGLESLLLARRTEDRLVKAKSYAEAIDHFATYVAHAPEDDPYVSIARGHERTIKKEAEPMQGDPIDVGPR